jgi:DNA-binding CsgD family transcriptional regulator
MRNLELSLSGRFVIDLLGCRSDQPRTVEWHLGNVFTKLGITSRKDLR